MRIFQQKEGQEKGVHGKRDRGPSPLWAAAKSAPTQLSYRYAKIPV